MDYPNHKWRVVNVLFFHITQLLGDIVFNRYLKVMFKILKLDIHQPLFHHPKIVKTGICLVLIQDSGFMMIYGFRKWTYDDFTSKDVGFIIQKR